MTKKIEINFTKKPEIVFQFDQFLNVEQAVDKFLNKKENLNKLIAPLIPANLEETIQKLIPEVSDGYTPQKGIDYDDGKDGETPSDEKIISLIEPRIQKAKDGTTPKKGIDYFTKQELNEIKKELKTTILSEMPEHATKEEVNIKITEVLEKIRKLPTGGGGAQFLRQLMDVNVGNPIAQQYGLTYNPSRGEFALTAITGGGAVDSVNGQTGVVVLDTDDITDTATNRYTNDTDITRLANTSGTNTGDQTSIVGITGSLTEFNTALTGAEFSTLDGTETLTSKTITTPVVSGTPSATSQIGYNTTNGATTQYSGLTSSVGSFPRVLSVGRPGTTKTNSTASDQDFTSIYTIPEGTLIANKVIRVTLGVKLQTGTSTATLTGYVKLGSTKVITGSASNIADSSTASQMFQFYFMGTAAAGASVAVEANAVSGCTPTTGFSVALLNQTSQPVSAIATNGALNIVYGLTWSATGSTETATLLSYIVEELN